MTSTRSDAVEPLPAIGLIEVDSVAAGIVAGDAMVKASPLASIHAGTVQPGRYLVLVGGDTASVEIAVGVGRESAGTELTDSMMLADVHPDVVAALVSDAHGARCDGDAIGIVETADVAAVVDATDAAVKAAAVAIATIGLADGLGGKGYAIVCGDVGEVQAAVDAAVERARPTGRLLAHRVVAQLAPEMRLNLAADVAFGARIGRHREGTKR